ncbi:MAG: anti-sigma factor [Dermatophilaceae bacterium]
MTHPDDDALLDLVLDLPVAADVSRHVRTCAQCTSTLQDDRRTVRLLREGAQSRLSDPPPGTWDAVAAHTAGLRLVSTDLGAATRPQRGIRPEPSDPSHEPGPPTVSELRASARSRAQRRWALLAGGVAAGVAGGLFAGSMIWGAPQQSVTAQPTGATPPSSTVTRESVDQILASTALRPVAGGEADGRAELVQYAGTDRLELSVPTMPPPPSGQVYEVWLLHRDGTRMISIGVMPDAGSAQFPIPAGLLAQGYDIVDVSREPLDNEPAHSGDSLLRGRLDV